MSKNCFQGFELVEGRKANMSGHGRRAGGAAGRGQPCQGVCGRQPRGFCGGPGRGLAGGQLGGSPEGQAPTCCRVKVVRLRRCFLRRNPSSKSPAE